MRYMFLALGIFMLVSCRFSGENKHPSTYHKPNTIIKDIPLDKQGKVPPYYNRKSAIERMMGLDSLEKGFDSLQIRIWYSYAFLDSAQLVILTKAKNKEWRAELVTFIYNFNEADWSILSISKNAVFKIPIHGWDNFEKVIFNSDITKLPDSDKLNGYPDMVDGYSNIIEIATINAYRIYAYQEPNTVEDYFIEAKKLERVLKLIETEFDFPRLKQ